MIHSATEHRAPKLLNNVAVAVDVWFINEIRTSVRHGGPVSVQGTEWDGVPEIQTHRHGLIQDLGDRKA